MNTEIKELWIKDLKENEALQGRGTLHGEDNKFCCLGRLCELHRTHTKDGKWESDELGRFSYVPIDAVDNSEYGLNRFVLPTFVKEWAGLDDEIGILPGCDDESLTTLNDNGSSFKQIAKIISEKF